jgi:hypothetical protein
MAAQNTAVRARQADRRGGAQGSAGAPVTIPLPVFPSFTFQQVATIAQLNELAYDATFLLTPPAQVLLVSSSAQSIPNATLTAITWQSATWTGPAAMWTPGSRATAPVPGYYDLDAQVTFAANATGARQVMFRVTTGPGNPGGAGNMTVFGQYSGPAGGAQVATGMLSPYMYAGDYVEVLAYQSSGGSLNTATPWCQLAACLVSLGP